MASFRGHLSFAGALGFVYGGLGANQFGFDPSTAVLGAGVTTVGGLLPDLDSDSGVPIREMFGLAGAMVPLLLMPRLMQTSLQPDEILAILGCVYAIIRYGLSRVFKYLTVHRGMFHSIPAMLIAGMIFFVVFHSNSLPKKLFLSAGVMIGFLSHLVLDELYSVNFEGLKITLKSSSGTALKFWSKNFFASGVCYVILGAMCYCTVIEYQRLTGDRLQIQLPTRE
jgi:membrane-bound metal-dependent hydrolase YbcI (DUF457 family)